MNATNEIALVNEHLIAIPTKAEGLAGRSRTGEVTPVLNAVITSSGSCEEIAPGTNTITVTNTLMAIDCG